MSKTFNIISLQLISYFQFLRTLISNLIPSFVSQTLLSNLLKYLYDFIFTKLLGWRITQYTERNASHFVEIDVYAYFMTPISNLLAYLISRQWKMSLIVKNVVKTSNLLVSQSILLKIISNMNLRLWFQI